jgi:hypothetical protein
MVDADLALMREQGNSVDTRSDHAKRSPARSD